MSELTQSLENAFNFKVSDYQLSSVLKDLSIRILIILDEQDKELSVSDALKLKEAIKNSELVLTKGSGHKKILINRDMIRVVKDFLLR